MHKTWYAYFNDTKFRSVDFKCAGIVFADFDKSDKRK